MAAPAVFDNAAAAVEFSTKGIALLESGKTLTGIDKNTTLAWMTQILAINDARNGKVAEAHQASTGSRRPSASRNAPLAGRNIYAVFGYRQTATRRRSKAFKALPEADSGRPSRAPSEGRARPGQYRGRWSSTAPRPSWPTPRSKNLAAPSARRSTRFSRGLQEPSPRGRRPRRAAEDPAGEGAGPQRRHPPPALTSARAAMPVARRPLEATAGPLVRRRVFRRRRPIRLEGCAWPRHSMISIDLHGVRHGVAEET